MAVVLKLTDVICPNCHEPMNELPEDAITDEAYNAIHYCDNPTCGWICGPDMALYSFFEEYKGCKVLPLF